MFVFNVVYPDGSRFVEVVRDFGWGITLVRNEYANVPGRVVTVTAAATDHALAYGEHDRSECGEWCGFPTGNESEAAHTLFFDETGPTADRRTYLSFGCNTIACGHRDFVVADDYASAKAAAIEAFRAVAAH